MKQTMKAILLAVMTLAMLFVVAGCAANSNPYRDNDAAGYNVSIKFDANGGFFATNTAVIVDSYNLADLPKDGDGEATIALLAPDDARRDKEAFAAVRNGYFLAGWYAQRIEQEDTVTYADKWDFEQDVLTLPADGEYTATEPVLTLYAAWVPLFEIEIYDLNSGNMVSSAVFSPLETDMEHLQLPTWDENSGTVLMGKFPKYTGYTWGDVYLDAEGSQKLEATEVAHPGKVNLDNATAENTKMQLYVDYMEGDWFHITTAKQLVNNASVSGNYILDADLDFEGQIWPTVLLHGNFAGSIQGNGHTINNISVTQTNNSKVNTGLFGQLTESASICDVTFENATLTIEGGTRVMGASFGLLAGTVSDSAQLSNVSVNGQVLVSADAYFGTDDYVIGLLCGVGAPQIDEAGITCDVVGNNAEAVTLTVEDGKITLTRAE